MLKTIKGNKFIAHILTLMSGTIIAQVIMLGSIAILTRLYTPAEFGLYSLFISIIGTLGLISDLKYEQAIVLPKKSKDANALVFISVTISILFSIASALIILFSYDWLLPKLDNQAYLLWLIPPGILFTGLIRTFTVFYSRTENYKTISTTRVLNAISLSSIQIVSRYFFKTNGLAAGRIIADIISLIIFIPKYIKNNLQELKELNKKDIEVNLKKYDRFPKYQTGAIFVNSLYQNLPIILLGTLFSPEIAGFYALSVRVLQAPTLLIAGSTRQVFYQRASKMHANNESFYNLYKQTTLSLTKIFIPGIIIILLFAEHLYGFAFGKEWAVSGTYSKIFVFWMFFSFINPPANSSYNILNQQNVLLVLEVITLILGAISLYAGRYIFNSELTSIALFTASGVLVNFYLMYFIHGKIKNTGINKN